MYRKVYFASDFHLGLWSGEKAAVQLNVILEWMDQLEPNSKLYLLGDIFDYWYEYKKVIPRGHTRFLGKLHELKERDISVDIFTGNHDMWMYDFFKEEYDIPVHHEPILLTLQGKRILVGHGDGLGPGDSTYKVIKSIFRNKWSQRLFYILHPDLALGIMRGFSQSSRDNGEHETYKGDEEWLYQYCEEELEKDDSIDYFVFGHRHLPIDRTLSNGFSRYVNLGDMLNFFTYATLEDGVLSLCFHRGETEVYGKN